MDHRQNGAADQIHHDDGTCGLGAFLGLRAALRELDDGEQHDEQQHDGHDHHVRLQRVAELFGAERLGGFGVGSAQFLHFGVQVGILEHEVLAEQNAGEQAERVHGLGHVETQRAQALRAEQCSVGVGRGLQEAQVDGLDEDGEQHRSH